LLFLKKSHRALLLAVLNNTNHLSIFVCLHSTNNKNKRWSVKNVANNKKHSQLVGIPWIFFAVSSINRGWRIFQQRLLARQAEHVYKSLLLYTVQYYTINAMDYQCNVLQLRSLQIINASYNCMNLSPNMISIHACVVLPRL
jgi:hypothetical protein